MLKKIAVAAMTLASFGAVIPTTAAAAERRPVQNRVVVEKRLVKTSGHRRFNRRTVRRSENGRKVVVVKHA